MNEKFILNLFKKNNNGGLSITDLVRVSKLSRSNIRTILAKLEGANKIEFRRIGMAKVYSLKSKRLMQR